MITLPTRLEDHLQLQHGLITLEQCRACGLTRADLRTLLRSGRWERVAPGVYGVGGHRSTWIRSLWLAHLHAGAESWISHQSAGRLHGCDQVPAGIVSITCTGNFRHGPAGVRRHLVDDLRPGHVTVIAGLPVTTLPRTIVDLASVMHIASLRDLVTTEITNHRVSVATLGACLDEVRRRGKRGVAKMARVLDDLGPGEGLPHSELERLLDEVIRLSGLPVPVHEYPLPGRGAVTGFVDRCWPEAALIVEADGRKWHTRRGRIEHDATRRLEAQAAGYETSPMMWEHLSSDPDGTAALLRQVYQQRLALLGRRDA